MKVDMGSDRCRRKAMKIAAVCQGVKSVSTEGENQDQVVVTGDGVDAVCLTIQMRKKLRYATLVSVEDMNDSNEGDDDEGEETPPTENSSVDCFCGNMENSFLHCCHGNCHPPAPQIVVVCDQDPISCTIV